MKGIQEIHNDHSAQWHTYSSLKRWRTGLLDMTGLTLAEVTNRVEKLFQFCLAHNLDPEIMAEECRNSETRAERLAFYLRLARETPANLIVQSFLVHNGVNVFGDLICMPRTRQQIVAEQGKQWIQDRA